LDNSGKRGVSRSSRPRGIAIAGLALFFAGVASAEPLLGQSRAVRAERFLQTYNDLRLFNGAALVVDDGDVLFRGAFGFSAEDGGANKPETRFRIASITKQFTAALVMRLVEEGSLDLDATIREYLPEYPTPQGDQVTIHHLLTHTSGIPSYTNLPSFGGEMLAVARSPGEIVGMTWEDELEFEPGTDFSYNNTGYVLLGWIVERVTGQSYDEALADRVLRPLELANTGYDRFTTPPVGHAAGFTRTLTSYEPATFIDPSLPHAAGMLYSTVDDLHAWGRALVGLDDGPFQDPSSTALMLTPGLEGYGYGVGISRRTIGREDSVRVIQHSGGIFGFSTMLRVFPDHDRMIVLLDNTSSDLGPILEGLTNMLWGAEAPLPRPSIAERLLPIVESAGPEPAMARYTDWKRTRPDQYEYGRGELMRLAGHFRDTGDSKTAAVILETQVEEFPDAPVARFALGEMYLELGDTTRAIGHLERALESSPGQPNLLQALLDLGVEPPAALRIPITALDRGLLAPLAGSYRIDPATTLDITLDEDGLTAARTGEVAYRLLPQSEVTFLLEGSAIQFIFDVSSGPAASVSILEAGRRVTYPRVP
jgi:CubicO group peptidase (beta-lactamase class C family)